MVACINHGIPACAGMTQRNASCSFKCYVPSLHEQIIVTASLLYGACNSQHRRPMSNTAKRYKTMLYLHTIYIFTLITIGFIYLISLSYVTLTLESRSIYSTVRVSSDISLKSDPTVQLSVLTCIPCNTSFGDR